MSRLKFGNQIHFIWRNKGLAVVLRKVQWTLQAYGNCSDMHMNQLWSPHISTPCHILLTCNDMLRPGPIHNLDTQVPIHYKQTHWNMHSSQTAWKGSRSTDQRYAGDNRLMTPKSSYRRSRLDLRIQLHIPVKVPVRVRCVCVIWFVFFHVLQLLSCYTKLMLH